MRKTFDTEIAQKNIDSLYLEYSRCEVTHKPYKIIKQELVLYRKSPPYTHQTSPTNVIGNNVSGIKRAPWEDLSWMSEKNGDHLQTRKAWKSRMRRVLQRDSRISPLNCNEFPYRDLGNWIHFWIIITNHEFYQLIFIENFWLESDKFETWFDHVGFSIHRFSYILRASLWRTSS